MDRKWTLLAYVSMFLSVALLATPKFAPICTEMMITQSGAAVPMRCHYAFQAEYLVGIFALLLSGGLLALKESGGRRVLSLLLIASGAFVFLIPQSWLIGICAKDTMDCHRTAHWMYAWAGLLIANSGFLAWLTREVKETPTDFNEAAHF
ncbi:DUF4418 family protein [Heliobacterium gestii]|uniref:DUF4418 family protein n=1 Tax=Heliomicrobium gestii TaxID=2699 RepID=A0A845L5F6_HELGE|nr:DUF4418 family protein [Heliomicrobium gestii]MBM7865592.1 hypothetical protein [Heliomicrobium gestii]MZP41842.1 DUF4418 family protein [Heliomicrobium gestii]